MRINKKIIANFIIVNLIILVVIILGEKIIGIQGRADLTPNYSHSWNEIWDELGILFLMSFTITSFCFWFYYKSEKKDNTKTPN